MTTKSTINMSQFFNFVSRQLPKFIKDLEADQARYIKHQLSQTHKVSEKDFYCLEESGIKSEHWVELDWDQPGDLEKSPCLVYCSHVLESGAVTNKDYRYI